MKVRVTIKGRGNLRAFEKLAEKLASGKWQDEAGRGLIDAGRKVRSTVAKTVKDQGAFRTLADAGPHIKGASSGKLTFTISAAKGGQTLEHYKGLRIAKAKKTDPDAGSVRSGIWNNPRRFARSFANAQGTFAVLPNGEGASTIAPKALWTFGRKTDQQRDSGGRFKSRGIVYPGIERLMGPSVSKELGKDEALATFEREAPMQTKIQLEKRLGKIMKIGN